MSSPARGLSAHLHPARPRHLPVMTAVFLWSFPNTGNSPSQLVQSRDRLTPLITAAVARGDTLIERSGLSFAFWIRPAAALWHVAYLAVLPQRRRHGTRLLAGLLARADDEGCAVALECVPGLAPWYRRNGFAVVGTCPSNAATATDAAKAPATASDLVYLLRPALAPEGTASPKGRQVTWSTAS
jgi:GNAT superfamily N-acetyltransferase